MMRHFFKVSLALGIVACGTLLSVGDQDTQSPPPSADDGGDGPFVAPGADAAMVGVDAGPDVRSDPANCGAPGSVCNAGVCRDGGCDLLLFVTDDLFEATLGSGPTDPLLRGDMRCNEAAKDAGLSGAFKAWLSRDVVAARERLPAGAGPYRLRDGRLVAASIDALLDGGPLVPPALTEKSKVPAITYAVYTGTLADGTSSTYHCANWSDAGGAESVTYGQAIMADAGWTSSFVSNCAGSAHLYCFEQP